ncbi:putative Holliday junction ATP-dependent DNA helicase RuvA [Candidatus Zixiibacteriota bacterium]|nr:putative Holliday junction ATP-dependent DNA helicase RuvA [candidate division Zixibacteria bacterium]
MISRISGKVINLTEDVVTIELNGLYYDVMIPSGLYDRLRDVQLSGNNVTLHTFDYIEAGDMKSYHYPRLVGFTDPIDKEFFQSFTTVSGLGIKKALKSLTLPIRQIATAIETKDGATLARLPGIGRRMAEKVIAELCGKMARFALSKGEEPLVVPTKERADFAEEAIAVLLQLQYKRVEAEKMVENALRDNPRINSAEDLITAIFNQVNPVGKRENR